MSATPSRDASPAAIAAGIARAEAHAPFLRRAMNRRPEVVARVAAGNVAGAIRAAREEGPLAEAARLLRREREGIALAVGLGDLAGLLTLEEVFAHLSDFADRALDRAIAAALEERAPGEAPRGFAALALGKHGSRELNYSSDIDPILLFDPATLPRRQRDDAAEAAVRIARRVVELLQARDGDGYVLRVDLMLRPSPEATPIALPVAAAISHYESSALPWERAAFIRARAAAGDIALGTAFLTTIRPFIWRRTLDYGAVSEIRAMSRRIREHHAQVQHLGPGYDIKRGRGGIREIEFFAQIHQLIHGGREPALRAPATLDALAALAGAGRIGGGEACTLADAYRLHRTIEHRLQMVEDQQTHRLPREPAALDNVARLHGLADATALVARLAPPVEAVGRIYDSLEADARETLPSDPETLEAALARAGFPDPAIPRARIEAWRGGAHRAVRTTAAREALEAVLPGLVAAIGGAPDPTAALNRFDDIVARAPTAINLFRLLEARPALAATMANILVQAPTLAAALGRRPALLDGLIDATALAPPPPLADLLVEFAALAPGGDYEALLDRVRQRVGERRFALGVQLVEGVADPLDVAAGYARVAEAALGVLTDATVAAFEAAHGRVPEGGFAILALGRLGGGALTHASDLDLIYLFTGDHLAQSDGPRPLGATHYFNRLAQRVTGALTVPTASGPLYEVDTRLRPSGAQGLLAVSVESFAHYQRAGAWTWEHMALTRARPVYGSAPTRAAIEAVIADTLGRARDPATLVADAVKMRGEMARHKPAAGPLDVKLIEGGLVDLEFAVHLTQLRNRTGFDPALGRAVAALEAAALLAPGLSEANDLLTRMLVTLRLVCPSGTEPPAIARPLVARACGQTDWAALIAAYAEARALVSREWKRVSAG